MPKQRDELRFLLIECRLDQRMIDHERDCLARAGQLSPEQIEILDLTKQPIEAELLERYDGVFIGGTGDYSVAQDRPGFFEPLVDLTREMLTKKVPLMGLCYGFHLMAHAVGGRVETREDLEETGTYQVNLTSDGQQDEILGGLTPTFPAQQGHHDVVMDMPGEFVRLAGSERCRWQAFRHPEAPYYGLQFHPELRREDFMLRMQVYAQSYASTPEAYAEIDARVKETENQEVIKAFVDKIVMGQPVSG